MPGNADSENSAGTIELLKRGAKPVVCGWDVMEELAPMFPGKVENAISYPCPECVETEKTAPEKERTQKVRPQKIIDKEKNTGYIDLKALTEGMPEEQKQIVYAIDTDGCYIDDIIERTGLSTAKVLSQLTILEIKGYVKRAAGRRIVLNTAKK